MDMVIRGVLIPEGVEGVVNSMVSAIYQQSVVYVKESISLEIDVVLGCRK
jgi:hypothetical protein